MLFRSLACQAPLSLAFSRQECWSGWPFPSPGELPDPGIEPASSAILPWQADSLPVCRLGSPGVTKGKISGYDRALSWIIVKVSTFGGRVNWMTSEDSVGSEN